mgnify:FL=1
MRTASHRETIPVANMMVRRTLCYTLEKMGKTRIFANTILYFDWDKHLSNYLLTNCTRLNMVTATSQLLLVHD